MTTANQTFENANPSSVGAGSLGEAIVTLMEAIRFLLSKWTILLVAVIVGTAIAYVLHRKTAVIYRATLDFMVNQDESTGGGGQLSSMLSSFGLAGIGGAGGEANPDKILFIARSNSTILPSIYDSVVVDGELDLLGNHVIARYAAIEEWEYRDEPLTEIPDAELGKGNESLEPWLRNKVKNRIIGSGNTPGLVSFGADEDSGIMTISAVTNSEDLSLHLSRRIYDNLATYYIAKTTEPQVRSFQHLKHKADSLEGLIDASASRIATTIDTEQGINTARSKLTRNRLERNSSLAALAYGKILQNLEIAEFSLMNITPFFQIVNEPLTPLPADQPSRIRYLLQGAAISAFLVAVALMLYRSYKTSVALARRSKEVQGQFVAVQPL